MSIIEWKELDPREAHFLITAFSVKNRKESEHNRKASQRARANRMVGR